MARKQTIKEVTICDACGSDQCFRDNCLGCGVEHCYECHKKLGVEYQHGVYLQGSGDGYYCNRCEANKDIIATPLHKAYATIRNIREQHDRFYIDFDNRRKAAEAELKRIQSL